MFVLDSDTYTHYLMDRPTVVAKMAQAKARRDQVAVTVVTKIELFQGRMSALLKADTHTGFLSAQQHLIATEAALENIRILLLDLSALQHFDDRRRIRGLKKIGRADLLIAGIVRSLNAILVTRNQRHFQPIPQLQLTNWVD
jgi:tRNA(fMet)-specific endonuclease VapC